MHRFQLLLVNALAETDRVIWENAGFTIHDTLQNLDERPDIIFWRHDAIAIQTIDDSLVKLIKDQLPKVWLTISHESVLWPTDLAFIYDPQPLHSPLIAITAGTKCDGTIKEPEWSIHQDLGPFDESACLQAIADTIYLFLLEDVIQETADWCGHMSSALRPM